MADDKVMIIMTSGPDTPRRCATPFYRRYARYLGKPFATAHDPEGGDGRA